ncbi:ATPase [Sesbania bispinosa]|nr:ATPase [Sesbania bispinosa]
MSSSFLKIDSKKVIGAEVGMMTTREEKDGSRNEFNGIAFAGGGCRGGSSRAMV